MTTSPADKARALRDMFRQGTPPYQLAQDVLDALLPPPMTLEPDAYVDGAYEPPADAQGAPKSFVQAIQDYEEKLRKLPPIPEQPREKSRKKRNK